MKFEIASILNRCTTELSLNKDINLAINNILQIVNEYFYERTFYTMIIQKTNRALNFRQKSKNKAFVKQQKKSLSLQMKSC